jgi:hypothetical protein
MDFRTDCVIAHPAGLVVETLRDRVDTLVPHLPTITSITQVTATTAPDGTVHCTNVWDADAMAPQLLRPVLQPGMLRFSEHSVWTGPDCEWRQVPATLAEYVDCHGRNTITAIDDATCRLVTEGTLVVRGDTIPGGRSLLGRRIAREMERFVVRTVSRSLEAIPSAVAATLAGSAAAGEPR